MELPKETNKIPSQISGQDKKTKETSHCEGASANVAREKRHHTHTQKQLE